MALITAIEWTDGTWNPVTGCVRIGPGCDNCYAARFAERWRGVPGHAYEQGFDLRLWPARLDQPLRWKNPRRIFVNSMSDLFLKDIPEAFTDRIFDAMEQADHHVCQILTKRSSRMRAYLTKRYKGGPVPAHIWPGVSVEDSAHTSRIRHLLDIPAQTRFISFEPLPGSIGESDINGIAWAIVGGESGPGARRMQPDWAIEIRDLCQRDGVAFFFKQWGGPRPKSGGRLLDGREWNEGPWIMVTNTIPDQGCPA